MITTFTTYADELCPNCLHYVLLDGYRHDAIECAQLRSMLTWEQTLGIITILHPAWHQA